MVRADSVNHLYSACLNSRFSPLGASSDPIQTDNENGKSIPSVVDSGSTGGTAVYNTVKELKRALWQVWTSGAERSLIFDD